MQTNQKGIAEMLSPSKNAIKQDKGDNFLYENKIISQNHRLRDTIKKNEERFPELNFLVEDLFNSFYKYNPVLNPVDSMHVKCVLNHQVIKILTDSVEYEDFRKHTRLDKLASQIATESFIENALKLLEEIRSSQEGNISSACQLQILISQAEEDGDDEVQLPGSIISIEEAKKRLEEFKEKIKDSVDDKFERKLTNEIQNTLVQVESVEGCISNWGLDRDETFQRMGYRNKVELIEKLKSSEKLKNISKLAGKLQDIYFKERTHKSRTAKNTVSGIKRGNNVGRALPADLIGLVVPEHQYMFHKRYAERQLREYEYGGKNRKGKGPIVCCIDTSMSMGGEKEKWSKAVALSLLDVARKQNRDFLSILFDSGFSSQNLYTVQFPKDNSYEISKVIDMAEYFGGGGTEFEPPLNRAREVINTHKDFSVADIIFITDGESVVGDDWVKEYNQWKSRKEVDIYSIKIGDDRFSNRQTLKEFSDSIRKIDDIREEGASAAISIFDKLNY